MNSVKPLINNELIQDISDYLEERRERDYVLFWTGIYTGRRIGDLRTLKIRDIKDKDRIVFIEGKTKKKADIILHPHLKEIYKHYCEGKSKYEYAFPNNRKPAGPISRVRIWQILNEAAAHFEYKDKIGCHTLRKTFGYWLYQEGKDIMIIKELLNQSDIAVTKRYIGIDQDQKDNVICNLNFGKIS